MSGKVFGDASEFYRLRVVRVDDSNSPDLEWRDDILYREPPPGRVEEFAVWRVEVVSVLDDEAVVSLGEYESEAEAEERMADAAGDLESMTKSAFVSRFVEP